MTKDSLWKRYRHGARRKRSRTVDKWVKEMPQNNPYYSLAGAIIITAVNDWRAVEETRNEVEAFFRSDWFQQLSDIDPEELIEELRKELNE